MSVCFPKGKRRCPSATARLLIRDILLSCLKKDSQRWRKRSAERVPLSKRFKVKRDWVVVGAKDWSFRTQRETFSRSLKQRESANRDFTISILTPPIWMPA